VKDSGITLLIIAFQKKDRRTIGEVTHAFFGTDWLAAFVVIINRIVIPATAFLICWRGYIGLALGRLPFFPVMWRAIRFRLIFGCGESFAPVYFYGRQIASAMGRDDP